MTDKEVDGPELLETGDDCASSRLQASRRGFSAQQIIPPRQNDDPDDDEPTPVASSAAAGTQSSSFIVLSPPTPSSVSRPSTLYHSSILLRQQPAPLCSSLQQSLSPTPDSESDDGAESAFSDSDAQRISSPTIIKSNSQYNLSSGSSSGNSSEDGSSPPMPMPIRTVTLGLGPSPYAASPSFISSSPRGSLSPVNSPPTEFTQPKRTKRTKQLSQSQSHIQVQHPSQAQGQVLSPPSAQSGSSGSSGSPGTPGSPQQHPLTSLNKKSFFNNSAPLLPCVPSNQPSSPEQHKQPPAGNEPAYVPHPQSRNSLTVVLSPNSPQDKLAPPSPQSSSSSSMSSSPTSRSDPEMGLEADVEHRRHRKQNKGGNHVHRRHHHRHHRTVDQLESPQNIPSSSSDNSIVASHEARELNMSNARPIRMPSSNARLMSFGVPQKTRGADDSESPSRMRSAADADDEASRDDERKGTAISTSDSKNAKDRRQNKSSKQPARMRGFFDLISPMFSRVARFGKKKTPTSATEKTAAATVKHSDSAAKAKDSKSKKEKKKKEKRAKTTSEKSKSSSNSGKHSGSDSSSSVSAQDGLPQDETENPQLETKPEGQGSQLRIELPTVSTPPDTPTSLSMDENKSADDSSLLDLHLTPVDDAGIVDQEEDLEELLQNGDAKVGRKLRTEDEELEEVCDGEEEEEVCDDEDAICEDDSDVCDEEEEQEDTEEGTVPYYEEMYDPFIFIRRLQQLSESTPPELLNVIFQFPPVLPVLPPKALNSKRVTLVLDLDETLVHCSVEPVASADLVFPVEWEGVHYTIHAYLRPGLMEFMRQVSELFEVVLFTASQPVYAGKICDFIDRNRTMISHRLFRQSCVYADGNYVKDLRVLGRDLAKTVIIDNSPQAFAFQYDNGIPILSYFDSKTDRELLRLLPLLRRLAIADDVRPILRNYYKLWKRIEGPITPTPFSAMSV